MEFTVRKIYNLTPLCHAFTGFKDTLTNGQASVVFVTAVRIQPHGVRCQEGPAAHAGVHVAVFELAHDLRADVIGHHAFRCALSGKLGQIPVRYVLRHIVFVEHIDQFREGR